MNWSKAKLHFFQLRMLTFFYLSKLLSLILFIELPPLLSVTALITKEDKLLFLDSSYYPGLGLPGGMVEPDESLEAALKREILEETGLKMTRAEYFTSVSNKSFKGIPAVSAVFLVEVEGEMKDSVEGQLIWLKPESAQEQLFYPDNKLALKAYLDLDEDS